MGVLNATPDSFSDGGLHLDLEAARSRVLQMVAEGASWIDVGGESTRPGAEPVPVDEELRRVVPVVESVAADCRAAGVGLSVDTRHERVARAAVAVGATVINDVSASLWEVAADLGAGWVAMHMSGDPQTMQADPRYDDVVDLVRRFLSARAERARAAGVAQVWVDPGIGFGKTTAHNLELLGRLGDLVADGTPVLVGTSRKRFTGELLARSDAGEIRPTTEGGQVRSQSGIEPVPTTDRRVGSLTTAVWAMILGARIVRVHDVQDTVRTVRALP